MQYHPTNDMSADVPIKCCFHLKDGSLMQRQRQRQRQQHYRNARVINSNMRTYANTYFSASRATARFCLLTCLLWLASACLDALVTCMHACIYMHMHKYLFLRRLRLRRAASTSTSIPLLVRGVLRGIPLLAIILRAFFSVRRCRPLLLRKRAP